MQARFMLIGLALMGAVVGNAQSFEEKISNVALLQDKAVQDELGITEELRSKMNSFAEEFNNRANLAEEDFRKKNPDAKGYSQDFMKKIEGMKKTLDKNVLGVLSKAQVKRLSELTLQAAGYPAMLDPTVGKKIGLSDAQIKKLRDSFQVVDQKVNGIMNKERQKIMDKYEKEYKTQEEQAAAQEKVNKEMADALKRVEPDLKKIRDEWLLTMKKTVKAIQLNRFDALMGKPFLPK